MFKLIYGLPFLLFWGPVDALVEHKIDEKAPLQISFSKASHNRIAIEGGSVAKVFGDNSCFSITIDQATGNAFVHVLKDIVGNPSTLTVVTSFGKIQDLAVLSSEDKSEFLILKDPEEDEEPLEITTNLHEHTVVLLNAILEGRIPLGYGQREPTSAENIQLPSPLTAQVVRVFEGPFENIIVYRVKNSGKDSIVVSTQSLKKERASWVFLNAHELKAKEEALCLMAFPKGEG